MLLQNYISMAVTLAALLVPVRAHPGEVGYPFHGDYRSLTLRQLERRQTAVNARHAVVRNCDSAIAAFEAKRRARRSALVARSHGEPRGDQEVRAAATSTANEPTYTALQNTTCVLTPEAEEGPYYIHEELIRTDIRDGMDGVPLLLDIGVMDVTTCTPMENALVDVWHCNATGIYSGFIASEASNTGNSSTNGRSFSFTSAAPSGTAAVGAGGRPAASDQETFGRGAYPTNSNGLVEFSTIFPGFYFGRTIHIHTAVLTNYTTNANGTIGQEAGEIRHVGQVFFEESWSELVVTTSPYNEETIERTLNDVDDVYAEENTAGYNATAQLTMLGEDLSDGLLGYVTLGVDPSASYSFQSTAYYTGEEDD